MRNAHFITFLLAVVFAASCKKNKDSIPPSVTISSPMRFTVFSAGTQMTIDADISDDKGIDKIVISVLSADGLTSISPQIVMYNKGTFYHLHETVTVGDIHTLSGTYQIVIEASDSKNTKKNYLEITVNEIARIFRKAIVVRKGSSGTISVDSLNGSSFQNILSIGNDYSGSAIDNYNQLFAVCGKTTGSLNAYQSHTFFPKYTISPEITTGSIPVFYFTTYSADELLMWISMASISSGKLKGINKNGTVLNNFSMQSNHYANAFLETPIYYITGEAPTLISGGDYLSFYYHTGYALAWTSPAPFRIQKIFIIGPTDLAIFGNNGLQGEMRVYNTSSRSFWEQVVIPTGKIYDVISINNDEYIISHAGGLMKYQYSTTNLVNLTTGSPCQKLNYDTYSGTLYGCRGNMLDVYNPATGAVLNSFTAADTLYDVMLHYNK